MWLSNKNVQWRYGINQFNNKLYCLKWHQPIYWSDKWITLFSNSCFSLFWWMTNLRKRNKHTETRKRHSFRRMMKAHWNAPLVSPTGHSYCLLQFIISHLAGPHYIIVNYKTSPSPGSDVCTDKNHPHFYRSLQSERGWSGWPFKKNNKKKNNTHLILSSSLWCAVWSN